MKRTTMKAILMMLAAFMMNLQANAQVTIKLWDKNMPYTNEVKTPEKVIEKGRITDVSNPEMIVYPASVPNGLAVVDCPGGAYSFLSMRQEGVDMAPWFNALGITYVVLKYRMPNMGHYQASLSDVQQAIKIMKTHDKDWQIRKVGVMGASAGGHLASTAATHYDEASRPDFQILLYPVITMKEGKTHAGSKLQLLGKNPSDELVQKFSNEEQVTPNTPPAFILHCFDDPVVPVMNSIDYFTALQKNKVSASLHIYPRGGHGFGYYDVFPYKDQWLNDMAKWLRLEILGR